MADGEKLLDHSAFGPALSDIPRRSGDRVGPCQRPWVEETDWRMIVSLYDQLMRIRPSPVVALNRAIAIGAAGNPTARAGRDTCDRELGPSRAYPFYHAALGEFELRNGNAQIARAHFDAALAFARNPMERRFLDQRVEACGEAPG